MKVILVGPSNRFHGGISSYLEVTAKGFADAGHDVGLILLDRLLPRFIYPGKDRLNDEPLLDFKNKKIKTIHVMNYYDLRISKGVRDKISDFGADFAIIHWWTFAVFPMLSKASAALSKNGCRTFIEMHEVIDQNDSRVPFVATISKSLGRRLLGNSDGVIVHSDSDKKLVSDHFGINENEIKIIPLANYSKFGKREGKLEARRKLGIEHEKVILFFGLIRKYKGVINLIKSFEAMKSEGVLLMIVGEIWDEKGQINSMVKNSDKQQDIWLFDRFVDDSEISTIYSSADLLAMPYSRASQSAVSGVAMDYGIPIVAFSVGGLAEALGSYENSILIEPKNIEQFSEGIREAIHWDLSEPGGFRVSEVIENWIRVAE